MTLEQINSRVSQLNNEVSRLNSQRAINLGKRETLQAQLDNAIKAYNETYGANIDVAGLDNEIATITADTEKSVLHMEQVLGLINAGNIEEAEKLLGVEPANTQTVVPQAVEPAVIQTVEPTATQVAEPVVQPMQQAVIEPAVQPMQQAVIEPAVQPIAQPVVQPMQQAVVEPAVQPIAQPVITPEVVVPQPVVTPPTPPAGIPTPPPVVDSNPAPMSFGALLGGTPFNPQGV